MWLRLLVPIALHVLLFSGVYQMGFTREQARALVGPQYRLIDPYLVAARQYGPVGVLRVYLQGESDDRLYFEYARLLWNGQADLEHVRSVQRTAADPSAGRLPARPWPYRDVRVEYPPLAFLAIAPPALGAPDYASYRVRLSVWLLALHLANLALAVFLVRAGPSSTRPHTGAGAPLRADHRAWERLLWASLAFCILLGQLVATRMDHLVVTWTLASLLASSCSLRASGGARMRWAALAGMLAAAGVMTKLVPGLALLAAVWVWLGSGARDRVKLVLAACAAALAVLVCTNAAMFALAGERYLETFAFHTLRGVQIESSFGGLILWARKLGFPVRIVESFGSVNLESPATELVKRVSPLLFAVACVALACRRWPAHAVSLLALTIAHLLAFILTNRVLSPQYLIWIAPPLLALAALERAFRAPCALFLACALLSQLIFPRGYPVLKAFHPLAIGLLNLRNLGLLALAWLVIRQVPAAPRALPAPAPRS